MSNNELKPIHLLIVDDHKLVRKALFRLIKTFLFTTVLYEASNGQEALDVLSSNSIDVVLLDVQMPVLNGFETMKQIKEMAISPYVLILSQFEDSALMSSMIPLGVRGFLSKDCDPGELSSAILSVMATGYYVDGLKGGLIQTNGSKDNSLSSIKISPREMEVLILLKDGKSSKEISSELNLTLYTVESYRKSLMKKTHCKNVAEVVGLAYRSGIAPFKEK